MRRGWADAARVPAPGALDDLEPRGVAQSPGLDRAQVEALQRPPSGLTHVERELVHVHVDERAAAGGIEAATERERVADRILLVVEGGLDAGAEALAGRPHQLGAEVAAHHVEAERY